LNYTNHDIDRVILTDIDGVVLNWEYAFITWMSARGFNLPQNREQSYYMHILYRDQLSKAEVKSMIRTFNESAAIGFLPPLRDAMYYMKKLHEEHGFIFHAITSLSNDQSAQKLRIQNLEKLFGTTLFDTHVFLDTGEDKDEVLKKYADTGLTWIEDKVENAIVGKDLGLNAMIMEHGHNMNHDLPILEDIPLVKNWKEIYEVMT